MVAAIMGNNNLRLLRHLARAKKRIDFAEDSYSNLDQQLRKIKDIGKETKISAPAKKQKLQVALDGLRKAMIEVIEAEKGMKFMRVSKSAEEIAIEKKILAMEGKLNDYLQYREKRLKRYKELEAKIAAGHHKAKLLPSPKPIQEEKLPAKISGTKLDPNILIDLKKAVIKLNNDLQVLKKDKTNPPAKIAELEKKIIKNIKRIRDLDK